MKKLMIAAAVAAMVGGAFAADVIPEGYNWTSTNVAFGVDQVIQVKVKAVTTKSINLERSKKNFGKPVKDVEAKIGSIDSDLAIDGVYYYDGKNEKWVSFFWNKNLKPTANFCKEPTFDIFENFEFKKAIAVCEFAKDAYGEKANVYGALKYQTVKDSEGKVVKIDGVKQMELVKKVSSLKCANGTKAFTVKTFKDTGKKDSPKFKTAQANVDAFVEKLWDKAEKVSKNAK